MNWHRDVEEWNELSIGQWPFGNPLLEADRLLREVMICLDSIDSILDDEEWVMDQEEAALDDDDNADDDDDVTGEDSDNDNVNFGLAPMLMNI